MKIKLSELRQNIGEEINEKVNFWSGEFKYDPRRDTAEDLAKGALRWYGFDHLSKGYTSSADPKFLKALIMRMQSYGIGEDMIEKVVLRLRMHKASQTNLQPV
jgi:cytochrome oxidase Cu insertion factor (SCO1/SenC/PrrC family)